MATPASPVARSSSTPTAAWRATAAAPSRARTPARSTAPAPTPCAGSPRTSWPPGSPAVARSRSRTPSATLSPSALGRDIRHRDRPRRQDPAGHREVFDLRPAAIVDALDLLRPIYRSTSRLRPLRTHQGRRRREPLHVGAHRPRGGPAVRRLRLRRRFAPVGDDEQTVQRPALGPVAAVVVETPLAHLDRVFEYSVPDDLDADRRAGSPRAGSLLRARARRLRRGAP